MGIRVFASRVGDRIFWLVPSVPEPYRFVSLADAVEFVRLNRHEVLAAQNALVR